MLVAAAHSAWAQYVVSARAGTISFINGTVSIDDKTVERKSNKFPALKDGQLLRTGDGRAEILLGPGVFVRLGAHAAIRMVNSHLTDTQVKLERGTALVEVIEIANGSNVHVLLGDTSTSFRGIGLHRFDADTGDVSVYGGHADVTSGAQTFDATRGREIHLLPPPTESRFEPRAKDPLLQWAAARSFHLYITNPAARRRLTNWEPSNGRYYYNRDYGVQFISRIQTFPSLAPPVFAPPVSDGSGRGNSNGPTVSYPGPASGGGPVVLPH